MYHTYIHVMSHVNTGQLGSYNIGKTHRQADRQTDRCNGYQRQSTKKVKMYNVPRLVGQSYQTHNAMVAMATNLGDFPTHKNYGNSTNYKNARTCRIHVLYMCSHEKSKPNANLQKTFNLRHYSSSNCRGFSVLESTMINRIQRINRKLNPQLPTTTFQTSYMQLCFCEKSIYSGTLIQDTFWEEGRPHKMK